MRLVWRAKARRDADATVEFIAKRNPVAAESVDTLIRRAVEMLTLHPFVYRTGRVAGTREAVIHPNYIIVYRVADDLVTIIAVIHARQNYP